MPQRLNIAPYDLIGTSVSYLTPDDPDYPQDSETYGVDTTAEQPHILGIGADHPDIVLTGSRPQVVTFARALSAAIGATTIPADTVTQLRAVCTAIDSAERKGNTVDRAILGTELAEIIQNLITPAASL